MSAIQKFFDVYMALSWVLVYMLVLIGTIKYKYPIYPPLAQLVIAPLEFSVLFFRIHHGIYGIDYVSIAYTFWPIMQLILFSIAVKNEYIKKTHAPLFFALLVLLSVLMVYLVAYKNHVLLCNYVNTFTGEVIWLLHFSRKDYPTNRLVLAISIIKLIADGILLFVYLGSGSWICDTLCVLLPVVDLMFITVYFDKRSNLIRHTPPKHTRKTKKIRNRI